MLPKIKPMITDVTVILDTEKRSSKTQGIGYVLGQMPRLVMLLVFASSSGNCIQREEKALIYLRFFFFLLVIFEPDIKNDSILICYWDFIPKYLWC